MLQKILILTLHGGDQLYPLVALPLKKVPPIPTDMRLDGSHSQNLRYGGKVTNPRIWPTINILRDTLKLNRKISLEIRMDGKSRITERNESRRCI